MGVTQWYTLTTLSSDGSNLGSVAWSNPSNAATDDANAATAVISPLTPSPLTEYLRGFEVSGAFDTTGWQSVDKVEVRLKASCTGNGASVSWSRVSLVIGGTIQSEDASGQNPTPFAVSSRTDDFELTADLPGVGQVSLPNFGVVAEVDGTPDFFNNDTLYIYVVQVRFTYTVGTVTSTGTGTIRVKSKVSWFNGISILELLADEFTFVQSDQQAAEGVAIVPVAESDFVLPDVSTPVLFVLRNIDDVSSVAIGPNNGGTIEPFLAVGPGELAWFRLADSVTIRWHSDIDDCLIQYLVLGA